MFYCFYDGLGPTHDITTGCRGLGEILKFYQEQS